MLQWWQRVKPHEGKFNMKERFLDENKGRVQSSIYLFFPKSGLLEPEWVFSVLHAPSYSQQEGGADAWRSVDRMIEILTFHPRQPASGFVLSLQLEALAQAIPSPQTFQLLQKYQDKWQRGFWYSLSRWRIDSKEQNSHMRDGGEQENQLQMNVN